MSTCKINSNKINDYIPEKVDFQDFNVDQTVIIQSDYLDKLSYLNYKKCDEENERCEELYPYVNSYYCYTEDCDPLSKVNSLLAEQVILESKRKAEISDEQQIIQYDAYSEREAQIRYLQSKPYCFIILGKPDIGQQELGKELSNYWGCVYIEPFNLITEEIESGSRAGQCIEFNLRCGRAVGIDIILKLVEQKVNCDAVKHRGFVLCGLPVIPNDLYEEDPVSSQSAIFTAQDIFDEIFTISADTCIAPSNPQVSMSSKFNSEVDNTVSMQNLDNNVENDDDDDDDANLKSPSSEDMNIGKNYEKQLEFLFNLLQEPYFIIYIQCGAMDVLNKRDLYRYDIESNILIDMQRRIYNQRLFNDFNEDFRLKLLVKLPGDFKANVASQLDHYHYVALNFIQNRVLAHNPEYFIKTDGRMSVNNMIDLIRAKLNIMNVQKVVIPYKIQDLNDAIFKSTTESILATDDDDVDTPKTEDTTEDNNIAVKKITPHEFFNRIKSVDVADKKFQWSWSGWGSKCPVSMKTGYIKEGDIKYTIQFMNKIFFLSDEESYWKFLNNPRLYLLPPYPRSTCKIFIFGPKKSGRTALAHCLAFYFNGTVLSTDHLMQEFMKQRKDEFLEKIRQQAIAEGIALLNKNRILEAEELEKERIDNIKEWVKTIISLLEELSELLTEIEKEEKQEKFEISSFPMAMKKVQTQEVLDDSEYAVRLIKLREELNELNVPIYKLDVDTWKAFLNERRKLLQYLPTNLSQKYQPKSATVFDDFVQEYVGNALAQAGLTELQISGGGILEMFVDHIKKAEEKYLQQGLGRGGWIIDGMMSNLSIIQDFYPEYIGDDIIVLKDESNAFLVKNYEEKRSTFYRDFRKFFEENGMFDAAWNVPSIESNEDYKQGFVKSILSDILENEAFYPSTEDDSIINLRVDEYKKSIENFNREWEPLKKFYLGNNIVPIEMNVAGKSLTEIFTDTLKKINSKYDYIANKLEIEEKAKLVEEEEEDRSVADTVITKVEENPIRYGDTLNYCPVTLMENFVLWKGNAKFAVEYNAKKYLLSSENDMKKFLMDPRKYLPQNYPNEIPPPRVCIIGVSGCGKTQLAKALSENYGLIYLCYEEFIKNALNVNGKEDRGLPDRVLDGIKPFWQEEPFKSKGFVFDDFPNKLTDIDYLVANKLIPDVIIYPQADSSYIRIKFLERYTKKFQEMIDKQKYESEQKYSKILDKWREQRSVRFNVLIEERREQRYTEKLKTQSQEEAVEEVAQNTSMISFDSVADQKDVDEVNKILDIEMPPIIYEPPEVNVEAYLAKTEPTIVKKIEMDLEDINKIIGKCVEHQIEVKEIPLNLDDMSKTEISGFFIVEPLKFRTRSYLETCTNVSLEIAENLLQRGYIFLSKFGRICPIQYYENYLPLQMYEMAIKNNDLFPIIHRNYVYFIIGSDQIELFKKDPLKYINQEFRFPLLNYKIAVTGPAKCGKSVLSKRIQSEYGFKLITRGNAVRFVLNELFESDLAKNMESVLRKGWELTDEMVIKSVQAATFDPIVVTRGVIFDGFPNSLIETHHLSYINLVPNLIIDLQASLDETLECLTKDTTPRSFCKYSSKFVTHIYAEWLKEAEYFQNWFDKEYQAMTSIPIKSSNWSVWYQSNQFIISTISEINHYHKHIVDDWPLRLGNMLITPLEFFERQSGFKTYCPVCLDFTNSLVNGGEPPDRTGVVQFRQYFYWLCNEHIEQFLKTPMKFLPPYNRHGMPGNVPKRAYITEMPQNIYENGACAVCYKNKRIITKGVLTLTSVFNERVYLFDNIECLNVFLRNPNNFLFGIEFHAPVYPELKYKELPVLGMLEQYLAKYIVQAVSFIAKRRPILVGLSIKSSALIGLGLHFKVKNEKISTTTKSYYEEGFRLYNDRRESLKNSLELMKNYRNPYLFYEEQLAKFQLPPATPKSESLTTMVSRIVDQCVDNVDIYIKDVDGTSGSL